MEEFRDFVPQPKLSLKSTCTLHLAPAPGSVSICRKGHLLFALSRTFECKLWNNHFFPQVSDASLAQMPEFRQRVDVLRRMQYLAEDDTVQMKVRLFCLTFAELASSWHTCEVPW